MTEKKFLDEVYDLPDVQATGSLYADWASSYDAETTDNGYVTPDRCAVALAACVSDRQAPVLDIGCGTGLSGRALAVAGFTTVDGTDLSPEMLARAERSGAYRQLFPGNLTDPLPVAPGACTNAAAVGVLNPGHAPPETVDAVLQILPAGGCLVLSLNDHALADPSFSEPIERLVDKGVARLAFCEHGPHLPGIGLEATVFVLEKQ